VKVVVALELAALLASQPVLVLEQLVQVVL
jgi:hypothetical protein